MPKLNFSTEIAAPIEICFDLSRSIEFHEASTPADSKETAIAGRTSGLIGLNEDVTWRAKHFGVWQKMTVRIEALNRPAYFMDSMVKGPFKRFDHHHYFSATDGGTRMGDIFDYESPLGILGRLTDAVFLRRYMERLLEHRNQQIKKAAESGDWKKYLGAAVLMANLLFASSHACASDSEEMTAHPGPVAGFAGLKFGEPVKFSSDLFGEEDCWPLQKGKKTIAWFHRYFVVQKRMYGFYCLETKVEKVSGVEIPPGGKYGMRENRLGEVRVSKSGRATFKPIAIPGWTLENPSIFKHYVAYWRESRDGTHASVYDLFKAKVIRDTLVGPPIPGGDWATFPLPGWDPKKKTVTFPPHDEYKTASFAVE